MILEACKTAIEMNRPEYLYLYQDETRTNPLLMIENAGLDDNVFKTICDYIMKYEYVIVDGYRSKSCLSDLIYYFNTRPPGIKDDLMYIYNFKIDNECFAEFNQKIKQEFFSQNYTEGQQILLL